MESDCTNKKMYIYLFLPLDSRWFVLIVLFAASKAQRLDDQALSFSDDQQQQTSASDVANTAADSGPCACELVPSISAHLIGL